MSNIDYLLERFEKFGDREAVIWKDTVITYRELLITVRRAIAQFSENKIAPGSVVIIEADFSPNAIATLLAAVASNAVVVPLTRSVRSQKGEFIEIAKGTS